jgi:predicted acylesterase/phospholipase RssA
LDRACGDLVRFWGRAVLSPGSALQVGPVPVAQLGLYLTMLYAGGANPAVHEVLRAGGRGVAHARRVRAMASIPTNKLDVLMKVVEMTADLLNVSTDSQLDEVLSGSLFEAAGRVNKPFFVSAFQTGDGMLDQLKLVLQGTKIINPGAPAYLPVHDLPPRERLAAVLASAAIPFACVPHEVGGASFIDGSYGGSMSSAGAVPLAPLHDLGKLDAILVVHTDSSSAFDASGFAGTPVLEIKPTVPSSSAEVGYFWADANSLSRWIGQGERDAEAVMGKLAETVRLTQSSRGAHEAAKQAGAALDGLE